MANGSFFQSSNQLLNNLILQKREQRFQAEQNAPRLAHIAEQTKALRARNLLDEKLYTELAETDDPATMLELISQFQANPQAASALGEIEKQNDRKKFLETELAKDNPDYGLLRATFGQDKIPFTTEEEVIKQVAIDKAKQTLILDPEVQSASKLLIDQQVQLSAKLERVKNLTAPSISDFDKSIYTDESLDKYLISGKQADKELDLVKVMLKMPSGNSTANKFKTLPVLSTDSKKTIRNRIVSNLATSQHFTDNILRANEIFKKDIFKIDEGGLFGIGKDSPEDIFLKVNSALSSLSSDFNLESLTFLAKNMNEEEKINLSRYFLVDKPEAYNQYAIDLINRGGTPVSYRDYLLNINLHTKSFLNTIFDGNIPDDVFGHNETNVQSQNTVNTVGTSQAKLETEAIQDKGQGQSSTAKPKAVIPDSQNIANIQQQSKFTQTAFGDLSIPDLREIPGIENMNQQQQINARINQLLISNGFSQEDLQRLNDPKAKITDDEAGKVQAVMSRIIYEYKDKIKNFIIE